MREANLKSWYSVSELSRLSGMEIWKLRRYLKREHPDILHKNGTDYFVYLYDLRNRLEGLWQSILEMETIKSQLGAED
jgi:hypothetical protein